MRPRIRARSGAYLITHTPKDHLLLYSRCESSRNRGHGRVSGRPPDKTWVGSLGLDDGRSVVLGHLVRQDTFSDVEFAPELPPNSGTEDIDR